MELTMAKKQTFLLKVVSAHGKMISERVEHFMVSAENGDIEIYNKHAPLLTSIRPGPLYIVNQHNEKEILFISGGFLEVNTSGAVILADTIVRSDELDKAKLEEAKQKAVESLMRADSSSNNDYANVASELSHTIAKLRVLSIASKFKR